MTAFDGPATFAAALADLPPPDAAAREAALARQAVLTKPPGSLGRLEAIAAFVAGRHGTPRARIERGRAVVFAGNHGVAAQGVSAFPAAVTAQMVANFAAGGAAINALAAAAGLALTVVPLDLDRPTADFTQAPAMTEAECLAALNAGAAALGDADLLVVGEMGIGNSTAAAALAAASFGGGGREWVGPGHRRLLDRLGLDPLLSLGLRLGEGSGAAVAAGVVRAALAAHDGMATFAEAGVAAG